MPRHSFASTIDYYLLFIHVQPMFANAPDPMRMILVTVSWHTRAVTLVTCKNVCILANA